MLWSDMTAIFADARVHAAWSDAQLRTIDWIVLQFAEHIASERPGFDIERFCAQSKRTTGRSYPRSTQEG